MSVTFYCLRYGRIPFECSGVLELYEVVRNDKSEVNLEEPELVDLFRKILEEYLRIRIEMTELRPQQIFNI